MYQVYLDVTMTRRKRLFHIMDNTGDICFSGPTMSGVLAYLHNVGELEFKMHAAGGEWEYVVQMARV